MPFMDRVRGSCALFLLLLFMVSQLIILMLGFEVQNEENEETQPFTGLVKYAVFVMKESHKSYWDRVKHIIHATQIALFPPNLDFRTSPEGNEREKMKESGGKSLEATQRAAMESANLAAAVVGEGTHTVHASGKAKQISSEKKESKSEL